MQAESASQNFGQQVHQLKMSRADEGATGPLGKDVSAMAHARNAERQAEKAAEGQATDTTQSTEQVDLSVNDSTKADAVITPIVTHNINESLQPDNETTEAPVILRPATDDQSLNDVIRSGFASLLASYQQQNPEQSAQASVDSFTTLMQQGVENGFTEAQQTLAKGGTLDEETVDQLSVSKEQIQNLISELASASSQSD